MIDEKEMMEMKHCHADPEATRRYYAAQDAYCTCAYCRNYYRAFPVCFPEAGAVLAGLGLSHDRSLEIMEYGLNDAGDRRRYEAYYPVQGTLERDGLRLYEKGAVITLWKPESISCPRPTMKMPYFIAAVQAELPWVMEEI